ncbi:MAG: EthD family reductase [Chloroflexi bacterium]|nr:EthD family reductase [Chloroflexota bacterium]MCI0575864.1 EthD family reductase [Chloroflexota bacterium]MCI0646591.1 EthD family reductase [Chloroflexota bacterium]MCI0729615.1 EthD family reductase [Chloroflexota bacterium]
MFKFVTIYRRVDDDMALESFFSSTHLPLAEQLPGLLRSEVSRVTGKPGGQSRFHLMYELYFESQDVFQQALFSEPGRELMKALAPWGEARIITWFYAESFEEEKEEIGE